MFKKFVKDYFETQKECFKVSKAFMSNHRLGCVIYIIACGIIGASPWVVEFINLKIKEHGHKKLKSFNK